jgi:hypothetical protein
MNIPTNREQYLQETFPLSDGTTYIQSLDKHNLTIELVSPPVKDVNED